tara:strand:- start:20002 stop:21192 length:1191 start_codon:yes stop_codon:yes gene_type:complete
MKNISDVNFKNRTVLIRVDFNVPLNNNLSVADNSRIIGALDTIRHVIESGGKAIILSHLGRPNGEYRLSFSLINIVAELSKLLRHKVIFIENYLEESAVKKITDSQPKSVFLLENMRFNRQEKLGCEKFANSLARLGDWYVNDAFGTLHRDHASTSKIASYFINKRCFGFLVEKELSALNNVLKGANHPFTAIIGGAKISGKIDVIRSLYSIVDNLIIGGGMAYSFIKALGGEVAKSLVEEEKLDLAKELITEAANKNVTLLLPVDSVNGSEFSNDCVINKSEIVNIPKEFAGFDIGAKSIQMFCATILRSKTIIWNGPMGVFEMSNFENGTKKIGLAIAKATKNGAYSLVGGGDSVAAIKKFKLTDNVSYISTGGGAMLEYLEGKKLPGICAIED